MQAKIKVAARAEEAGHRMKVLRYMCVLYLTTCVSHYYKAAARAEEAGHRLQVHMCVLYYSYMCVLYFTGTAICLSSTTCVSYYYTCTTICVSFAPRYMCPLLLYYQY